MTEGHVFRPKTMRAARDIILTPESGMTVDQRWEAETPWIVEQVSHLTQPGDVVVDFGCGVGRLARAITLGCNGAPTVVGVDASPEMRKLAIEYCQEGPGVAGVPGFTVTEPWGLNAMAARGFRADVGIAVWSLQHIRELDRHVTWLARSLKPDAPMFVLNSRSRWLPIENGWAADAVDVHQELVKVDQQQLRPGFTRWTDVSLPSHLFGADKWCAIYRRNPDHG